MDTVNEIKNKVVTFICEKPEVVSVVLAKNGYIVETKDKSLNEIIQDINEGVFTLLYNGNQNFANDLSQSIFDEGYSNFVADAIGFVGAFGGALINAFTAKKIAKKQRALETQIATANRASEEKMANAKLATITETERVKMIQDALTQYAISQQAQSTLKQLDTWMFVAGVGGILVILYGIILVTNSKK